MNFLIKNGFKSKNALLYLNNKTLLKVEMKNNFKHHFKQIENDEPFGQN